MILSGYPNAWLERFQNFKDLTGEESAMWPAGVNVDDDDEAIAFTEFKDADTGEWCSVESDCCSSGCEVCREDKKPCCDVEQGRFVDYKRRVPTVRWKKKTKKKKDKE